ncbi:HipA domain-containing protein [Sulfurospirillum cavolei]|uniref:HipA domain-containing protein n=1 Tax=Sulfurospirillum cavolei TaxID=366522 RepID=UPI0005A9CF66|nr:HipA domain-containing protein [Sulfurospirillum cavolei]
MICLGCLQDKKLLGDYCKKCMVDLFDGKTPKALNFDKTQFYRMRSELAERMSISGVQDKLSLAFNDRNELVPVVKNGHYILKPIPMNPQNAVQNVEDMVANEHLSMRISKDIFGIHTAESGLIKFSDGELAYITKRFDYAPSGEKYDQEDFTSVLDVTSAKNGDDYKYAAKTYIDCAKAIRTFVPTYIPTLEDFFKRVVLNYLICNGDAHLKNFSLYRKSDALNLTPNYDIMNTRLHLPKESLDTGLSFFEESTKVFDAVGFYSYYDFKYMSQLLNMKESRFTKIVKLCQESEKKVNDLVENSFLSNDAKEFYKKSYHERLYKRFLYVTTI